MKISSRPPPKTASVELAGPVAKAEEKTASTGPGLEAPATHPTVPPGSGGPPASSVTFAASVGGKLWDGWLKVHSVDVTVTRGGVAETQALKLLQRPGHDSTHVETLRLHGDGPPTLVYKDGDTRPTAALRGTPYVATGIVAGSLDHDGVDAEATALQEIAEEVGGQPLGRLVALGAPAPTMPVTDGPNDVASSESDHYWLGVLSSAQGEIKGDGSGHEVAGLLRPIDLSIAQALEKIDSGGIRENARARVALSRGLDKLAFVPQLNAWLRDLPPALQQRFDNLGLGATYDPATATTPSLPPQHDDAPATPRPPLRNAHLAKQIDGVDLGDPKELALGGGSTMLGAHINHLAGGVPVGGALPLEALHSDFDRLKLAQYFVDPKLGPMVKLELAERPLLAAKAAMTGSAEHAVRFDVTDLKVPLPAVTVEGGKAKGADGLVATAAAEALKAAGAALPGAKLQVLSAPSYASPGQTDLRYHFLAAEVPAGGAAGFVTLAEALRRCRAGTAGDANTEALLLRLADHLGWAPQLQMSVRDARAVLER